MKLVFVSKNNRLLSLENYLPKHDKHKAKSLPFNLFLHCLLYYIIVMAQYIVSYRIL